MANKLLGLEDGQMGSTLGASKSSSGLFYLFDKDATRSYFVLAENLNQTEDSIAATTGIPQIGSTLNGAAVLRLRPKEIGRVRFNGAATALWSVSVETDSKFDPGNLESNPTDMTPKRRWYTEKEDERIETDLDQKILETTAKEPLNAELPFVNIVLEIERYENYPTSPSAMFNYANHCNQATFYGAPIGTVLLDDIQSDEETINNVKYIKVRYVFKFRLREFVGGGFDSNTYRKKSFLNQGYMYRRAAGAVPELRMDKHGHPIKVNLNTDGTENTGSTPNFVEFVLVEFADFSALNLEF